MIETLDQAKAVQTRRMLAKKRGYAKAVRRFLKRGHYGSYGAVRAKLNVIWPDKHIKAGQKEESAIKSTEGKANAQ